jgi:hypothetical protein
MSPRTEISAAAAGPITTSSIDRRRVDFDTKVAAPFGGYASADGANESHTYK